MAVLSQLGVELLSDHLIVKLAQCGLAGLGWSVSANPGGLLVQVTRPPASRLGGGLVVA